MFRKISEVTFDQLEQLDMRDVVEELGLHIERSGTRLAIRCPNPEHEDRRIGNCAIYADHVHCFACGYHARPLRVTMDVRNESLTNAAKWLCKVNGIPFNTDVEVGDPPVIISEAMLNMIGINERSLAQQMLEEDQNTFFAFVDLAIDKKIEACQRKAKPEIPEVTNILRERIKTLEKFKAFVDTKCKNTTTSKIIIR